jgi:hypothetical protein
MDRNLDRAGAVVRGDARRDAVARLDRVHERGAVLRFLVPAHLRQAELVAALGREAEADEPASVRRHEVDRFGRRELCRDHEIAFVLPVGIVHDDDEAAAPDLLDRFVDRGERRLRRGRHLLRS